MRRLCAVSAGALLALLAGCGGGQDSPGAQDPPAATQPGPASTPARPASPGALTGVVGEEGDPDAFSISLTDSAGNEVSELPAGEYEIQVSDLSTIHNFNLTGPGVDEATSVPETGETTWTVTLQAGEYTFVCQPHRGSMNGSFTVS